MVITSASETVNKKNSGEIIVGLQSFSGNFPIQYTPSPGRMPVSGHVLECSQRIIDVDEWLINARLTFGNSLQNNRLVRNFDPMSKKARPPLFALLDPVGWDVWANIQQAIQMDLDLEPFGSDECFDLRAGFNCQQLQVAVVSAF